MQQNVRFLRTLVFCTLFLSSLVFFLNTDKQASQAQTVTLSAIEANVQPSTEPLISIDPTGDESLCSPHSPDEIPTYQQTLIAAKDTWVDETNPTINYGAAPTLTIMNDASNNQGYVLVAFNLGALPTNAVIASASLELYGGVEMQGHAPNAPAFYIDMDIATDIWYETTVTWNTQPSTINGDSLPTLYRANQWTSWDVTALTQDWLDGTRTNHGVVLVPNTLVGASGARTFGDRTTAHPPRLIVEYWLQTTHQVQADTFVSSAAPDMNYGHLTDVSVGRVLDPLNELYALLQFDTSSIPANSTIISAALGVYPTFNRMTSAHPQAELSIEAQALLRDWDEMSVDWITAPGAESQGDPPHVWINAQFNWWDVTNIVQGWSTGALLNYGIMLKPTFSSDGTAEFVAYPNANMARLIITYGPPPCYEATGVTIAGPTQGITDTDYTFEADITPVTATLPITYTWEATDQSSTSGATASALYTWPTPGVKTVTVTVENCGSTIFATHEVTITEPPPTCEFPLTGLSLDGPTQGITSTEYTFTATTTPANATEPVTFTWEAAGQTPETTTGGPTSVVPYTWSTPGEKHITVTAQNCGGNVEFVQYHTFNVIPLSQLPDLQISGMWYNPLLNQVNFIVKNTGNSTAPPGHTIDLYQTIAVVEQITFTEALPPGWVRAGTINHVWSCSYTDAQAKLCVDSGDAIVESDEANNCLSTLWPCDIHPPLITAGPTVVTTTEHTALITWVTNEPCTSRVDYAKNLDADSVSDATLKTSHEVTLDHLTNASTYWFTVFITDEGENLANSNSLYFETQPPGTDPVVISSTAITEYPSEHYEFYTLEAVITDTEGVDSVIFFLDQQLIGQDFTPDINNTYAAHLSPAAMGLSRADWLTAQSLKVWAYNLEGELTEETRFFTPPARGMSSDVLLLGPDPDKVIYTDGDTAPAGTSINALAYAAQYRWGCTDSGLAEDDEVPPGLQSVQCDDVRESVTRMDIYLDDTLVGQHIPTTGHYVHSFNIDLSGKGIGTYTLRLEAHLGDGTIATTENEFRIERGHGELGFSREVTRRDNVFEVTLTIENIGTGTIYVDYVRDFARGFQVINTTDALNHYTVRNNDKGDAHNRRIMIDLYSPSEPYLTLAAGETFEVNYKLVPILYRTWQLHYYIGSGHETGQSSQVLYWLEGIEGSFSLTFQASGNYVYDANRGDYPNLRWAVDRVVAESNYILVTSPQSLYFYIDPTYWRTSQGLEDELDVLLSDMAELASLRNGVLGYLPLEPDYATVDALLEPGGHWADALSPYFRETKSGYVLFVGEDEIIPAQDAGYGVPYGDLRYASTAHSARPELILGRIIGNDLGTLQQALEASIDVARTGNGFDRQRAVLSSGRGGGEGTFWTHINQIEDRLNFNSVTRLRWKNYDTSTEMLNVLKPEIALGQGLILYRGHGGTDSWNDTASSVGLGTGAIGTFDLGGYHPFVFGLACDTGNYRDGYSIGEAFYRRGAAFYIGAVSPSDRDTNGRAGRAFFNRWGDDNSLTIGYAFVDMARDHWGDDSDWKKWIYQYHMFGDPKFGALAGMTMETTPASVMADGPIGNVHILIPDYDLETDEAGSDHVSLPGGSTWLSDNEYAVPYWKATYTYPAGQRVQDVTLTAQSSLTVATGLNLAVTSLEPDCGCAIPNSRPTRDTAADPGWYPAFDTPYKWSLYENPDGTTTLDILITPLTYNPTTTDLRFYQDWSFEIDVITTTAEIVSLKQTQPIYRLDEAMHATLVVDGGGVAQDLVVWSVIKSLEDESAVAALPLQTLHTVSGTAILDLEDTLALAAGNYALEVTLANMVGHVLDTATAEFTLGVAEGEITALTATPAIFKIGDTVGISLTFQNTGELAFSGTAIVKIQTSDGITQSATFTQSFISLAPGATFDFTPAWDTAGAAAGDYRVVSYIQYDNFTTLPVHITLTTYQRIYIPVILRNH